MSSSCGIDPTLLSAYVDGELAESERTALQAHLGDCDRCRNAVQVRGTLKHAIARLSARAEPPEAVRVRIEALALGQHAMGRRRRVAYGIAAAVTAAALAASFYAVTHRVEEAPLADELVADHLRSVPEARPAQVASDDPQQIQRFFAGRVPFQPVAPEMPGSRLLGGRLCVIRGHAMQLLFYERERQTLSLFVSRDTEGPDGCRQSLDHQVCQRRRGDLTLRLVGRFSESEVERLVRELRL